MSMQVCDTFGPVVSPYYVVCFKDGDVVGNFTINQDVYFAPAVKELTNFVLTAQLQQ